MLLFFSFFFITLSYRTCLDDPYTLQYANTHRVVPLDFLEDTPIHYGGWQTTSFFSLITQILLREYLGLPCHLYPPLNESIFEHDIYWDKWINSSNEDYWTTWQQWFESGAVHIFPSVTDYQINEFDPLAIYRQYFNGVSELAGLFIPHYMNERSGSKDYRILFNSDVIRNVSRALGQSHPSIIAQNPEYAISKNTEDFLRFHNLTNIGWNLTYYENIDILVALGSELYDEQKDFVILTSNPDDIFALLNDPNQGRKLEHIYGPDNPSGTILDPCVDSGECFLPLATFYYLFSHQFYYGDHNKGWDMKSNNNSVLFSTMKLFWNLTIPRTDINDMIRRYMNDSNDLDAFDVACKWVKDHNHTLFHYISTPVVLETTVWEYTKMFQLTVLTLAICITVYLITGLVVINLNQERTMVKRMSVTLSNVWLTGCIMLVSSSAIQMLRRTVGTCILNTFLDNIGVALIVVIPAVKGYRISRIFNNDNLESQELTNAKLLKYVAAAVCVELALATAYTFVILKHGVTEMREPNDDSKIVRNCTPEDAPTFTIALLGTKGIYLCFLAKYGWATRKAWKEYRETIWLLFATFFTGLMFFSLLGFWAFDNLGMITQNVWVINGLLLSFTMPTSYLLWVYLERNDDYEFDEREDPDYVHMDKDGRRVGTLGFTTPRLNGSPTFAPLQSPSLQAMAKADRIRLKTGKKY